MRLRLLLVAALLVALAALAFAQGTTARLDGTVVDPQGAAVAGAQVMVVNTATGQPFQATTDERGAWVIPSMPAATYRVTVTMQGFKTTAIENVKIDAGVPATVNAKLELGQLSESVEVNAGAEIVQTTTASVNTTLQGRQVFELPFTSRNALELLVTQPGTQTGTTSRNSFINGLPTGAINITTDGINTQDNYYKSGDGFFTVIPVKADSVQEVTLTTSAAGADSLAQGAAQVKFVTKGGSNEFHRGAFWQHRNTALNANYYFNNINGLPRDRIIMNQGGVHIGGPILKNKLFFFTNYEIYRQPATSAATRTVLAPTALNGDYIYPDAQGGLHTVNLYQIAAAGGFTSTPDPIIQNTLQQINSLTPNGVLQSRIPTKDYNRNDLIYQPSGMAKQTYDTTRLDYNINDKHHLEFIWTYYLTDTTPDITNGYVPIYPGTGTILGQDSLVAGQRGNRYSGVVALRSSLSPSITNELRGGMNRALSLFRDQVSSPALFSQWRGYSPGSSMGYALGASSGIVSGVAAVSGSSRRSSPVKELHDTLSLVKGAHLLSLGGDFTQIDFWAQTINSNVIPTIRFGIQPGDPVVSGGTNIFNSNNFPGASQSQLDSAAAMYALLTGRVSSIGRTVSQDEKTHQFANVPAVDRAHQREWGAFVQDSWKVTPTLTVNAGLRFEQQMPFVNTNNTYSSVGYEGIWGISGVGNWFKPGVMTGINPTFNPLKQPYATPKNLNPSAGFAWQLPQMEGALGTLFGRHQGASVLRGGYSISTVREGMMVFQLIYGSNLGLSADASVNPNDYPLNFGAPGSVLFRDATLPTRAAPTSPNFPIAPSPTDSLNDFDPNLKMGYVQSWNLGFQRELTKDTVLEVRYTGNHGVKEWRQVDLNEVNLFENGFLDEFYGAQKNLLIARQLTTPSSVNFGNQGLPGQVDVPILKTALGFTSDTATANNLVQNRPGSIAGGIYANQTRMNRLIAAGYPKNMFVVNPDVVSGGTYLVTNWGSSYYNALQLELKRRMSRGLLLQGSYTWAHSIVNGATNSTVVYNEPTTFRNLALDRIPSSFDIRHAFKLNWIYEMPFGPGRHFLSGVGNPILRKAIEGWEIAGVSRIQSGTPFQLTSGRSGMNTNETGVVLHNMTAKDLASMMQIRKGTNSKGVGVVYYLPDDVIENTLRAFEVSGRKASTVDESKPYIGPQLSPYDFGYRVYLYQPWQTHLDMSVVKITRIREKANVEFRAQILDALNLTNFYLANGPSSSFFGQTTSAYRDFSGTGDPGARMVEFILRVNF